MRTDSRNHPQLCVGMALSHCLPGRLSRCEPLLSRDSAPTPHCKSCSVWTEDYGLE